MHNTSTGTTRCFDNFRAMIADATHGAIVDAPLTADEARDNEAFHSALEALSRTTNKQTGFEHVNAITWVDRSWKGVSWAWSSNLPCPLPPQQYRVTNLKDIGWDNHISSFRGYGCRVSLYEHPNFQGNVFQDFVSEYVGWFNDKASSLIIE